MRIVRPYGDARDDGAVQLSFTLPMPWSAAADEAARRLVAAMGFTDVTIAEGRSVASGFAFFVVYARTAIGVDLDALPAPAAAATVLPMDAVDALVLGAAHRPLRVAGACIGADAHTVGIDAILNMKGYDGDPGLERYHAFEVLNLGSQVAVDELVRVTRERALDVLLVSQLVTQKGSDVKNFTALAELLEAERLRDGVLLIAGGPRMTNALAAELGYDAGFGRGTHPGEVATFIARRIAEDAR